MKKKKQQTKNLIILAVVTVGIVLGLWAMNSKFSLNSKAAGNCQGGIFIKGGDKKCYEVLAQCGSKCCNKVVDNKKCKDSKYVKGDSLKELGDSPECPGNGNYLKEVDINGNIIKCYLENGKFNSGLQGPYCTLKVVPNSYCK